MPEPTTALAAVLAKIDSALGFSISTFIFGALGGCISWRWVPQIGFLAKLSAMASAGGLAAFVSPIVRQITGIQDEHLLFGAAGLIGIFGLSITASIFDALRNTKWTAIIEKRLGLDKEV